MNVHTNLPVPLHQKLLLIFLSFIIFTMMSQETLRATESRKAAFLPLKITSLSADNTLAAESDMAFSTALFDKEIDLIPRSDAQKMLDYQAGWPPAPQILNSIEQLKGYTYIIAGTLTEIGGQVSIDVKLVDLLSPNESNYYSAKGNRKELSDLFSGIASKIAANVANESVIASIAPSGNEKIDSGAILKKILTKPGDPYNPESLRQDLKEIYNMGYFDDIQIEVTDTPEGKAVIFKTVEKPIVSSVIFTGIDEIDEEKVKEVVTLKEQDILNPIQLKRDSDAIQLLYKSKGYYNTTATTKVSYPTTDSAEVRFVIEEGKKIYIKAISFEGNTTFDDDELEDEIETNTKGWFSWLTESGLLDYDKLNQDTSRILNFYSNHGFLEAKIGDPVVIQEEEWLYISFAVEEGPRFKIGTIDIQGDLLEDKDKLLSTLASPKEEFVSRKILREDILKITDIYAEQGFANANISPNINKADRENTINIIIEIDKNELVYINRINIVGNSRTRDNVIRRDLKVEEGGIFNAKALRDSVQKLQYLDYFEEVNITPEQSFDKNTVDLSVEVKDKSTGQFTIGAGYSSVDNLILMGEISENNFLGRGDTLSLSANVGGESNNYNLRYKNPRLNDSMLSWGLDIFDMNREYDDYTKDSTGGAINFGYPVWERWRGYANYSYTDTDLSDIADDASYIIRNSANIHVTSAVGATLSRDTRNRRFGPSEGSVNELSARYAGGPLGGDSQFTKIEAETSWYFPLFWDTVFHFRAAAGQVFENETDSLPVYERFYLGGLRTVRGYDYGKISPIDPETGDRIGGDKMWFTNIEYIFPLLTEVGINGVVFYDMGNVFAEEEEWGLEDFSNSVGVGIRWFSPMGPLRLEWGYNLDPEADEDQSVWDFSIGGVF